MFVDPSGLANKYFIAVFAGINTNIGSFEQAAAEIKRQLLEKDKEATVNCITIYPYDDTISGDLIDDVKQVVGNAHELSWSSVSQMAAQVKSKFEEVGGADYIHFVGYSGGGVAASRVAEKLSDDEWTPYISSIIRVGSPNLAINNWYWGYRTTDLVALLDYVPTIKMPRYVGLTTQYVNQTIMVGLKTDLSDLKDLHTSYFKDDENHVDIFGRSNLYKIVNGIIMHFR